VIVIAMVIVSLLPYLKDSEQFSDTKGVALNNMEQNFKEGKYKEILID
jgi:hypothetical protein